MAYLIFTSNGLEYDRRELAGAVVIGRAQDCAISIHDIILSRHHCRLEPQDGNANSWIVTDLHSKNGTFVHGRKIEVHSLADGEELRIGRTRVTFKLGAFVPSTVKPRPRAVARPADPSEALAGTVSGMVVCEPGETEGASGGRPFPQPRPADPSSYKRDDVYGMINEIISSSWDSIMAQNSQPIRVQRGAPTPLVTKAQNGVVRPKPRVSICLQAGSAAATKAAQTVAPVQLAAPVKSSWWHDVWRQRRWMVAAASLLLTITLVGGVLLWRSRWTPRGVQAAPATPPALLAEPLEDAHAAAAAIEAVEIVPTPADDIAEAIDLPSFDPHTPGVTMTDAEDGPFVGDY